MNAGGGAQGFQEAEEEGRLEIGCIAFDETLVKVI